MKTTGFPNRPAPSPLLSGLSREQQHDVHARRADLEHTVSDPEASLERVARDARNFLDSIPLNNLLEIL